MSVETVTDISRLAAPYGKELTIQTVSYEGGLELLRIRIKEGKRFTMLDLDPNTAEALEKLLADWRAEASN